MFVLAQKSLISLVVGIHNAIILILTGFHLTYFILIDVVVIVLVLLFLRSKSISLEYI